MRSTKEKLAQMDASERKNRKNVRAFVDGESFRANQKDDRPAMLAHYEADIMSMSKCGEEE